MCMYLWNLSASLVQPLPHSLSLSRSPSECVYVQISVCLWWEHMSHRCCFQTFLLVSVYVCVAVYVFVVYFLIHCNGFDFVICVSTMSLCVCVCVCVCENVLRCAWYLMVVTFIWIPTIYHALHNCFQIHRISTKWMNLMLMYTEAHEVRCVCVRVRMCTSEQKIRKIER